MAANPPRHVTAERERKAWELRQQFWTEQRIADELGCDKSTVCRMLKRVETRLAKEFSAEAEQIKARQTAQLEQLAGEVYAEWVRSKGDAEYTRVRRKAIVPRAPRRDEDDDLPLNSDDLEEGDECEEPEAPEAPEPAGYVVESVFEVRGQAGNPALLAQLRGIQADIRTIWGCNAPLKTDLTSAGEKVDVVIYLPDNGRDTPGDPAAAGTADPVPE